MTAALCPNLHPRTERAGAPDRDLAPTPPPVTEPPRSFFERLTRDGECFDAEVTDPDRHDQTLRRLLGFSVLGSTLFGAAVGLVAQFSALPTGLARWLGPWPLLTVPVGLTAAFLLAIAICLPSFYFYTQLSGLDAPFRLVTAQALRVQGRTSVLMLGALPVYVALALAGVVGVIDGGTPVVLLGLFMPFVIGIFGLMSLYASFGRLSTTLPVAHARRPRFLPRMVVAWGAVYSAVCPLALYRIIEALGQIA